MKGLDPPSLHPRKTLFLYDNCGIKTLIQTTIFDSFGCRFHWDIVALNASINKTMDDVTQWKPARCIIPAILFISRQIFTRRSRQNASPAITLFAYTLISQHQSHRVLTKWPQMEFMSCDILLNPNIFNAEKYFSFLYIFSVFIFLGVLFFHFSNIWRAVNSPSPIVWPFPLPKETGPAPESVCFLFWPFEYFNRHFFRVAGASRFIRTNKTK